MPYHQKLSKFITNYLNDHNMTRSDFAVLTKLSFGTVNNYIQMKTEPDLYRLYKIALYTKQDVFSYISITHLDSYTTTIEKVHRCKTILERLEEEITIDMIKNIDLSMMVLEEKKEEIEVDEGLIYMSIERAINNYVHTKDISYSALAKKVKVDKSQISQYINHQALPTLSVAIDLCKIMNVSMQELLGLHFETETTLDSIYQQLVRIENELI